MIIVRLIGGLGNQMFPYAMGRRLAHVLGDELLLDIDGFDDYADADKIGYRRYALGVFNVIEKFADAKLVKQITDHKKRGGIGRLCDRLSGSAMIPRYYKEKHFHFDQQVLRLKGDVYLKGNWNSEHYFADVKPIIRKDFTFKAEPQGENKRIADTIGSVNAISVHIRRGDYVTDSRINRIHGTCDLDYYQQSIDHLTGLVSDPHFFIFSDDPAWPMDNLKLSHPSVYVDHNDRINGHEDMRLMSLCQHNIIANSGFSWWGAWLNSNPDKIVCAPEKWFSTPKYDTRSLIPEGWVRF